MWAGMKERIRMRESWIVVGTEGCEEIWGRAWVCCLHVPISKIFGCCDSREGTKVTAKIDGERKTGSMWWVFVP
jgi:hypothetical protein